MIKILDNDLAFALKIADEIAIICGRAPECFFGKERRNICPVQWRDYIYPSLESIEEKLVREHRDCPILGLRLDLENNSPLLYGTLKKICEEVEGEYQSGLRAQAEKRHFFAKFLLGFLAIYSASGYYVPNITKDIFQKLAEEEKINEREFCRVIEKDLQDLNPRLYKILLERLRNCEYSPQRKKKLFSLFRALLSGIKIKRERENLFAEVDKILKAGASPARNLPTSEENKT